MFKETDAWSPDQELRLLEELAEAEAAAFDVEMELPIRVAPAESEKPWLAYWNFPPNGEGSKPRMPRGR